MAGRGRDFWSAWITCRIPFFAGATMRTEMNDEAKQLRRFVDQGDEEAFNEIVENHFALVYSTALRQLNGDAQLAQDVAQIVFTDLARKARWLPSKIMLAGWLYQAARFSGAKTVRTEQRRRAREEAFVMQESMSEPSSEWDQIRPLLDAAMARLDTKDRDAVLLHYFELKSFRTVGAVLGLSDDAAQKRVSRALAKLRTILAGSGVPVSASCLSSFLIATVPSAPAGLASSVAKSSELGGYVFRESAASQSQGGYGRFSDSAVRRWCDLSSLFRPQSNTRVVCAG
jgi:RNA polymerase sigma factor (sigma-70 family)